MVVLVLPRPQATNGRRQACATPFRSFRWTLLGVAREESAVVLLAVPPARANDASRDRPLRSRRPSPPGSEAVAVDLAQAVQVIGQRAGVDGPEFH